jgi:hypothetical protein
MKKKQVLRLFCSYCVQEYFLVWDQCVLDEDRARLGEIVRSGGIDGNRGFKKLTSDTVILSNSCRANDCMCCRGKGANLFSFKKSYTDIPNNSETKQRRDKANEKEINDECRYNMGGPESANFCGLCFDSPCCCCVFCMTTSYSSLARHGDDSWNMCDVWYAGPCASDQNVEENK